MNESRNKMSHLLSLAHTEVSPVKTPIAFETSAQICQEMTEISNSPETEVSVKPRRNRDFTKPWFHRVFDQVKKLAVRKSTKLSCTTFSNA